MSDAATSCRRFLYSRIASSPYLLGMKTRNQAIASLIPLSEDLLIRNVRAVRRTSMICRLNRTYARNIDRLVIELQREDFIAAIDHINSILRNIVNVAVLSIIVDRLPRAMQTRLYAGVFLPHLYSLAVSGSSLHALRLFLDVHRHSLRDLYIEAADRRSVMAPHVGLLNVHLDNIIGSTNSVAEILRNCDPNRRMVIWLSGETRAPVLQRLYPLFHQYHIAVLCIVVSPRDHGVLATLAMCFPRLRCLKIIEKGFRDTHVWSKHQAWVQALQGLTVLSRLSLQITRAIDAGAIRVAPWFPYGTSTSDIEMKGEGGSADSPPTRWGCPPETRAAAQKDATAPSLEELDRPVQELAFVDFHVVDVLAAFGAGSREAAVTARSRPERRRAVTWLVYIVSDP
ncbi:hypothetical protein BD626DRAFT_576917 [Schizophyllum amplum]|uniref:Uncharacterized protein n=1 Tax=Schizophyllum amplum TaxID=97359 RepID=A0A550BSW1_9AGAR|nr:hypothetical protein BD626DRAFT_576917 [Auriculariopsis ampla]